MSRKFTLFLVATLILVLALSACQPAEPEVREVKVVETQEVRVVETQEVQVNVPVELQMESERLAAIKANGVLRCGVNSGVPGFGFLNEEGDFVGFDVDFCRALATAIFNNPDAVEFRPLTAAERFTALQTNEIDVLIRNTTWTFTRDVELGTDFGPTTFYDGQGMMVRRDSGFGSLNDMDGATVCVLSGTTTELNLADAFASRGISYTPLVFDKSDETAAAYDQGRCDGLTSDKSQLAGLKTTLSDPAAHLILPETMSKEPLGPVWAHGDQQWGDMVRWVVNGLMIAEEKGITAANVAEKAAGAPEDPEVARLLGLEGEYGQLLGLDPDFMVNVISAVGNYGEIYERHLGPDGTDIPREGSFNALASDGGLIYPQPWR
ncbi:MAG: amino acid ABC transporter substrate-binding protein [Anaerolineales bacterium]|nr:amino acid ABC transporter substrate-binding protein [Anaerolineales bacterium]